MKSKKGRWIWLTPLLLALPFAALVGFAAVRYGGRIQDLIHVAIKLVVTK